MSVEISYEFARYLSQLAYTEPVAVLNKLGGYNVAGQLFFTSGQDYITQQWKDIIGAFEQNYAVVNYYGQLPKIGELVEPPKKVDIGRELIKGLSGYKSAVDKLAIISLPHESFPCTAAVGIAFLGCIQGKIGVVDLNSVRCFVLDLLEDDGICTVFEIRRDEEEVHVLNVRDDGSHSHEDILRAIMLKTMNML